VSAHPDDLNWKILGNLRQRFLDGTAGESDYWETTSELEQYDATFAQRIGWKWDFVIKELKALNWEPPNGPVLDWGCGSGVAGRMFMEHFANGSDRTLFLNDRSSLAMRFATERARDRFPGLSVLHGVPDQVSVLLISHVATELTPPALESLVELVSSASSVIWVEPGTYEASLTLIAVRERLRQRLHVVAPCTHSSRCGILDPQNKPHWCHFFAPSPREIFTDRFWSRFGEMMEIDLRSLPLSYLALDRRPVSEPPPHTVRVIGRPSIFKPYAEWLACDQTGVRTLQVTKRSHPEAYRQLKKGKHPSRIRVTVTEGRVNNWNAPD